MKTTIQEQDGNLVAIFEGRLDTAAAPQTEQELQPLKNCQGHDIVLDCTELAYISSSGLRIFITLRKAAAAKGGKVIVRNISNEIRSVFMMTGFLNLFEIQ